MVACGQILIILVQISINVLLSCGSEIPLCEKGYKSCCAYYKWNTETQQCEKCLAGYSGDNCSLPCPYPFYGDSQSYPYPYYGDGCQARCDCEKYLCNISVVA
ncbi:scavenger receptor class F member 1-like, partial [Saccostrea cucullata]|uniref:scavenger receptor class F member 1-like n=1 Tax=Saccostrea cuccullata TaxID=36930 RepID=UPI002ED254C1